MPSDYRAWHDAEMPQTGEYYRRPARSTVLLSDLIAAEMPGEGWMLVIVQGGGAVQHVVCEPETQRPLLFRNLPVLRRYVECATGVIVWHQPLPPHNPLASQFCNPLRFYPRTRPYLSAIR